MTSPPILNRVNADLSKQAQDFFRRKNKNISHTLLHFNNNIVLETPYQKHPGIFDASLTFEEHLKVITTKVNKIIRMLWQLQKSLLRLVLITVYKAFVKPHLDCGNIIYDEAYSKRFHQTFESF